MKSLAKEIKDYYRNRDKRAVFQLSDESRIIIVSQAPGKRVHETGIPWNDASGKTLRDWLGVSEAEFYNKDLFSIMPMDFCYPGKGPHGDLPPDPRAAPKWHPRILEKMKNEPLILLIGSYAINYYLDGRKKRTMVETVRTYKDYLPDYFPMPHPSPRNRGWLKNNPWFENENLPFIKNYISHQIKKYGKKISNGD